MLSFLKSTLSLYQLALLSIPMVQGNCLGFLMKLSNIFLESTFFYSLSLFSFSWLICCTALLFSWQYLPRWRIFRWSRNPKIQTIIETYHTPYTPKHRYWTGLLLIVRVVLYLAIVVAVNVSNDRCSYAIIFTVCCILALSKFFGSRLYRKWPVGIFETFFYLNILSFATFT